MLTFSLFFLFKKMFLHMLNLLLLCKWKVVSSDSGLWSQVCSWMHFANQAILVVIPNGAAGVAVEVVQGLQLVLSIWFWSRLTHPIDFVLWQDLLKACQRVWHLTDHKIKSSAQELPPPHNPINANMLLTLVCPPSRFLQHFLRLSFQNPACLISLARGISS